MTEVNNGYLGVKLVDISKSEDFKDYNSSDWAMYFIECYGQFNGACHKAWVLDQVAKILLGSEIIVDLATWENGDWEYRVSVGDPSEKYLEWVRLQTKSGEYDYDPGICP